MDFRFNVVWMRQGKVRWNQDWVDGRGYTRSHVPDLRDHISFANHDLRSNGLPVIEEDSSGLFIQCDLCAVSGLPSNAGMAVLYSAAARELMTTLGYHGFAIR